MDEFLKFDGYVMISSSPSSKTWEFIYRNYAKEVEIKRTHFKTYDECIAALKAEHERIIKA